MLKEKAINCFNETIVKFIENNDIVKIYVLEHFYMNAQTKYKFSGI